MRDGILRDGMVFYRSFYEAVSDLPPEEFKESVMAILGYGLNGEEADVSGVAKAILTLVKPQIDKNNMRYKNSLSGGRKPNVNQIETKQKPNVNQIETNQKPNDKVNDKVNDNVVKESTLKGVKEKRFAPPTPENVSEYCREKGIVNVDAERFVDFYSAKGWMVGKNRMKDWKAAVRNWARSQRQELTTNGASTQKKPANRFGNFEQRDNDYEIQIWSQLRNTCEEGKSNAVPV